LAFTQFSVTTTQRNRQTVPKPWTGDNKTLIKNKMSESKKSKWKFRCLARCTTVTDNKRQTKLWRRTQTFRETLTSQTVTTSINTKKTTFRSLARSPSVWYRRLLRTLALLCWIASPDTKTRQVKN